MRDRVPQTAASIPVGRPGATGHCGLAPFGDDTSTARATALVQIRARVAGTVLRAEQLQVRIAPPISASKPARIRLPKRYARLWIAAAAVLVAAAVVGGIFVARGNGPARALPAVDSRALELAGTDPVTGRRVDLAAYRGKPIVLNVWGSWCEGCRDEARDLARFAVRHPEVQVVGLDLQDTRGAAKAFYARYGWRHPSIFDPNGKLAFRLGLQGTPTTFFLDARHRPVAKIVGAASLREFERGLRASRAAGR